MPQEPTATEIQKPKVNFFTDSWQIIPEMRYFTSNMARAKRIIRENEFFFRSKGYSEIDKGKITWKFQQSGIPDIIYGTKPTDREWLFSYTNSDSVTDFELSAITIARHPDTKERFGCLPEIRIKMPLSDKEIESRNYVWVGKLGVCIGLRLLDGSIMKEDGGNPKTLTQTMERAGLVVDTFITYLNSILLQKP